MIHKIIRKRERNTPNGQYSREVNKWLSLQIEEMKGETIFGLNLISSKILIKLWQRLEEVDSPVREEHQPQAESTD